MLTAMSLSVTLQTAITIITLMQTLSPSKVTLPPSGKQQFTASVLGTSEKGVKWSISPKVGTISATGLYTAPATILISQTIMVTAQSVGDPTKSANAQVALRALRSAVSAHTGHRPSISNAITFYGLGSSPANLQPGILDWVGSHFDWVWGGNTLDPHGNEPTAVYWAGYTDSTVAPLASLCDVQATAAKWGFNMENMMLHQSIDMQINNGYQWTSPGPGLSKPFGVANFDGFDVRATGGQNFGGVFTMNGSTWSDITYCAYIGSAAGCHPPASTYYGNPTVGGTLYIGYQVPFDQINFDTMQVARAGGTVAFNYWNGSEWAAFASNFTDGTAGLSTAGQVHFYPPADWQPHQLVTGLPYNNHYPKYWVQIVVSGAATPPVVGWIYGDDWSKSSSGTNSRGWSASDSHRINIGTPVEYNPTPPSNASAHFRYQARVTGFWAPNYMVGNQSDYQNRMYTWGRYLADSISAYNDQLGYCTNVAGNASHCNYDAAFFDDAGGIANQIASPSFSNGGKPWTYYDYVGASSDTDLSVWAGHVSRTFEQVTASLKSAFGGDFEIGFNSGSWKAAQNVDFDFVEGWLMNSWSTSAKFQLNPSGTTYDSSLPTNNPAGTKLVITCGDYLQNWNSSQNLGFTYWHYLDLANRTPLSCLAQHWLGWNNKTSFSYHTVGYGYYIDTDEAYVFAAPTTTTSAISPCTSGSCNTTITLADASSCTSGISAPDYIALSQNGACPAPSYRSSWRIGSPTSGDTFDGCLNGNTLTTNDYIYNSYPVSANAYCITKVHQSLGTPAQANVYKWGPWFPAREVDLGTPNASGYRAGARAVTESGNTPYQYGGSPDYISGLPQATCNTGQCSDLWRRDFTNGIVLFRPWANGILEAELDTPSKPIALGGTYYPLRADGTTAPGITSITLRANEGAILMNVPIPGLHPPIHKR